MTVKSKTNLKMKIARNLKGIRTGRFGYTQVRVQEITGICVKSIIYHEKGRRMPTFEILERYAKAYECTVKDLLDN